MNPLDNNSFTFKLKFNNPLSFGTIEMTEPVKFDGATYIVEQQSNTYGRDVSFMNDNIDLFFYEGTYDTTDNPLMLPNGTIVYNLTMCLPQLLEARRISGFESDIEFILLKDDVEFSMGVLDLFNSETDDLTYLSCKVVQNTSKQIIKRREDLVVDVFSDEDLDGETITPISTTNMLLKAKPETQISKWISSGSFSAYTPSLSSNDNRVFTNTMTTNTLYGIEDTISFFDRAFQTSSSSTDEFLFNKRYNMGILDSKNELTDLKYNISDLKISLFISEGSDINSNWRLQSTVNKLTVYIFTTPTNNTDSSNFNIRPYEIPFTTTFIGTENVTDLGFFSGNADRYDVNIDSYDLDLEDINDDYRVSLYYNIDRLNTIQKWISSEVSITTTATAIDSTIKGTRYIDLFKQNVKSMSGFNVYAPKFDVGGKYYDQFAFSGNLIKGRDDLAFSTKFKDLVGTLDEFNAAYQILKDKVYIGQYEDFYPNKEIGVLEARPDESSSLSFNDRFGINEFGFSFKNYEQDKDEENTIDAVHTSSQWSEPNKQVENVKKIELEQIRDPYIIETSRKEAIKTTTSTSTDEKLFLIDAVTLAPSTLKTFTKTMAHNIDSNGRLQLLNDNSFSWSLLGFSVGSYFRLNNTGNIGDYTVFEITDNIITLSGSPSFNSAGSTTTVQYYLDNVLYTNRTNEGFILIENLLNPDKFSNLRYTIKRGMSTWFNYLATCSKYVQDKVFRNTEFINNGALVSQYQDEADPITENANINCIDFGVGILTPNIYTVKLVADWQNAVNIINAINTINDDDTIGGFIRTYDNNGKIVKGYPKKLEYEPSTETLTATLEERNEGEFVSISVSASTATINEVGYELTSDVSDLYEVSNDYFIIYDDNKVAIINPTRFDKISVDGVYFDTSTELSQKLIEIL